MVHGSAEIQARNVPSLQSIAKHCFALQFCQVHMQRGSFDVSNLLYFMH